MFFQEPGYEKVIVQGYEVYVPPPPEDKTKILNYGLHREEQKWKREPLPSWYIQRRKKEKHEQEEQKKMGLPVTHCDPICEEYRRDQWMKRIYGVHIYINGKIYYLTGDHWMYLQWTKQPTDNDSGYPDFYYSQIPRFYFRELCKQDPFCLGYIIIGPRGFGKSVEEGSVIVNDMTKPPHNRRATLQSKTEDDAKESVFQDIMVMMFNNYPEFFKPVYSHGTDPKDSFVFKRQGRKGRYQDEVEFNPDFELGNTVVCKNAKETAVDSKSTANCLTDEVGKTDPSISDVYVRNEVLVKCVYRNERKRGLIRATTTVEKMDEGGKECEKIWKEANPDNRDENGYTKFSHLYRYFVSGVETKTQFADEFGFIDEEKANDFIQKKHNAAKHDTEALSNIMRKDPRSPEEAFIPKANKTIFDPFIITQRITELRSLMRQPGRKVHLHWSDGINSPVLIEDNPDGLFTLYYLPDDSVYTPGKKVKRKVLNAVRKSKDDLGNTIYHPVNNDIFAGGGDPVKNIKTHDARASKLAAYGFRRHDIKVDGNDDRETWQSYNLAWKYNHRSGDPTDDFDNIHKVLYLYGHTIMPEGNVSELNKHLNRVGFGKFWYARENFVDDYFKDTRSRASKEEAVATVTEVWEKIIQEIRIFLWRHGMRIQDLELLEQLKDFDIKNPTAFDLVVAFGYTLMSLKAIMFDTDFDEEDYERMQSAFPQYTTQGPGTRTVQIHNSGDMGSADRSARPMDYPGGH